MGDNMVGDNMVGDNMGDRIGNNLKKIRPYKSDVRNQ
jgi:hypothetical protein